VCAQAIAIDNKPLQLTNVTQYARRTRVALALEFLAHFDKETAPEKGAVPALRLMQT
jgi:hypothetical protein